MRVSIKFPSCLLLLFHGGKVQRPLWKVGSAWQETSLTSRKILETLPLIVSRSLAHKICLQRKLTNLLNSLHSCLLLLWWSGLCHQLYVYTMLIHTPKHTSKHTSRFLSTCTCGVDVHCTSHNFTNKCTRPLPPSSVCIWTWLLDLLVQKGLTLCTVLLFSVQTINKICTSGICPLWWCLLLV